MTKILETDRLFLREINDNDFNDLCEILMDKDVMYAYDHPFNEAEVKNWYKDLITDQYKNNGFGLWAVIHKESDAFMGQCGLTMQDLDGAQYLEIGYLFKKKYWHNGYAAEAALGCKKYAFETLNAERVYSIIRDNNIASQNVAIKAGMKKIKEIMKHYSNTDVMHYLYEIEK